MMGLDVKILFFIVATLSVCVYVAVSSNNRQKKKILNKITKGWGRHPQNKYSSEEFENISHYFRRTCNGHSIDDITWNDLGMDEIFKLVNNTYSSVGQEYLYRTLRQPDSDMDKLKKMDVLAEEFTANEKERIEVQKVYNWIGRVKHISVSDYMDIVVDMDKRGNLVHYLALLFLVSSILFTALINPVIGIWLCIASVAFSVITYYRYKAAVEKYFVCVNYLIKLLSGAKKISKLKYEFLKDYSSELDRINDAFSEISKNAGVIESGNIDGSIGEMLLDYVRMLTHIDLIKFNNMASKLKNKDELVYRLIDILGFIESSIAVASFRVMLENWCKPKFKDRGNTTFEVEDVYHPLIEKPVANSIAVRKHILLTGSNASGKSTFLKTIAVNAILSQTIYTSVSKKYVAPRYRIYSSMALRDDLGSSSSYYIVEIKSLKRILDAISSDGMPVLCFVDEVLRGTNTVERIAASSEILKSIDNKKAVCFAATHDVELTTLLMPGYENYHFQEEVTEDEVLFNFILYKGPATTRNAIKLLKTVGYDYSIIAAAQRQASYFLDKGMWNVDN
ncbi:MAG: hypothetical protein Q4F06_03935 [Eubacteriales bacterium]|nr:hypothetical protein [Eubacteriales bacterium]